MKDLFRHIGIVVLATIIGFLMITCGDGGGGGLPSTGNGAINLSAGDQNWQVYDRDTDEALNTTVTFTECDEKNLSSCFTAGTYEVKITNGKLSLKLGTPNSSSLEELPNELSVTDGLKIFGIKAFYNSSEKAGLYWANFQGGQQIVFFVYASKDGTVSGTIGGGVNNWDLKSGWNTVMVSSNGSSNSSSVTGTPGSNFKWYCSGGSD